jgi:hypothetical protein
MTIIAKEIKHSESLPTEEQGYLEVKIKIDPVIAEKINTIRSILSFDVFIYFFKRKYDFYKNPIYVWEAIALCIKEGKNFPEWVINYLSEAGNTLLEVAQRGMEKENAETVRDALKFNFGQGKSPFSSFLTTEKYLEVYLGFPKIIENIKSGKITKLRTQSYNQIIGSKFGIGEEVVKYIRKDKMIKRFISNEST